MYLFSWWTSDPPLVVRRTPGFRARVGGSHDSTLAAVLGLTAGEIATRLGGGHRPYAGYERGEIRVMAWVTSGTAALDGCIRVSLEPQDRVIWGLVPRSSHSLPRGTAELVREITRHEPAERFWLLSEQRATPFLKIGMQEVAKFAIRGRRLSFVGGGPRAETAHALFRACGDTEGSRADEATPGTGQEG